MSDRVIQLIDNIKEKSVRFHAQYQAEKKKNQTLEEQLKTMGQTIQEKDEELATARNRINELLGEIKTLSEQKVDVSAENKISDQQIDELVKEIEYCISQLKQ